jgi:hypothetical protein
MYRCYSGVRHDSLNAETKARTKAGLRVASPYLTMPSRCESSSVISRPHPFLCRLVLGLTGDTSGRLSLLRCIQRSTADSGDSAAARKKQAGQYLDCAMYM